MIEPGGSEAVACRFFTLKHGSAIFLEGGTTGQRKRWNPDEQLFQRWKDGKTGMPLVDANMRELKETGQLLFLPPSLPACDESESGD